MRTVTYSKVLYSFDELNDKAKDRARERMREFQDQDTYWSESVIDDFVATVAPCFGWTIGEARGRRSSPAVYFSGFGSQGDGAQFEGSWRYVTVNPAKLANECPPLGEDSANRQLEVLMARLMGALVDFTRHIDDSPTASVKSTGRYSHEYCTDFSCEGMTAEQELIFVDVSRDLMRWLYRSLEREYNYQNSDRVIDENIRANGYEFDEYGNLTN